MYWKKSLKLYRYFTVTKQTWHKPGQKTWKCSSVNLNEIDSKHTYVRHMLAFAQFSAVTFACTDHSIASDAIGLYDQNPYLRKVGKSIKLKNSGSDITTCSPAHEDSGGGGGEYQGKIFSCGGHCVSWMKDEEKQGRQNFLLKLSSRNLF